MSKSKTVGNDLFLVTSSASSNLLPEGRHTVVIESISGAEVKHASLNDPTPQAKMVMREKNGKRIITDWLNLQGYKQEEDATDEEITSGKYETRVIGDRTYLVNPKTGCRIPDKVRREAAMGIIAGIGEASGIAEGKSVNPQELLGREVGVVLAPNEQGNMRVKSYFKAAKATAKV